MLAGSEDVSMGEPTPALVSHVVARLRRGPTPPFFPPHLRQEGELVMHLTYCSTWVSQPKGVCVRELVPQLVCWATAWAKFRCPPPPSCLAT